MPDWLSLVAGGAALSAVLMTALWWWHLRLGNAGVVDVGWSAALPLLAVLYAAQGPGFGPRPWLMAAMVGLWGTRLAIYLLRGRMVGHPEDPRYAHLRARSSPARTRSSPRWPASRRRCSGRSTSWSARPTPWM